MRRKFSFLLILAVLAAALSGCGQNKGDDKTPAAAKRPAVDSAETQFASPASGDTIAIFDTSAGEIRAVLYPSHAPQACENFITLAGQGFYNGTSFTRIVPGFCVEAGLSAEGATSTAWGGSGFSPEVTDELHHYSGALCAPVDSSSLCSSLFYFMDTPAAAPDDELITAMQNENYRAEVVSAYQAAGGAPYLDYTDTVFGQVYSGMEVVDAIGAAKVDDNGATTEETITINTVTISQY